MSPVFDKDDAGFPILLAEGSTRRPSVDEARSKVEVPPGDKAKQNGHGQPKPKAKPDQSISEQHRRHDAVRDAAREFETFTNQDLKDWLRGRITRPLTQQEVDAFEADVRAQVHTDLADILDQMTLGESRGRRLVKVKAPRGYLRKSLNSLTDDELRQLEDRLRARGWTDKHVKEGLHSRLSHDRRAAVSGTPTPQATTPSHSDKVQP
jgi:hypothetical protein